MVTEVAAMGQRGFRVSAVAPRRTASQTRAPSAPTTVPTAKDAAINRAWTQRNEVGEPCPTAPVDQARGSFQIARANLGQMTHVHTPTPTRNQAHRRDNTIRPVSPPSRPGRRARSCVAMPPIRMPPRRLGIGTDFYQAAIRDNACPSEPMARDELQEVGRVRLRVAGVVELEGYAHLLLNGGDLVGGGGASLDEQEAPGGVPPATGYNLP